jgi:hypothetical protein
MEESEEYVNVLDKVVPSQQESLECENIPDPMEGEQTWPTEEELAEGIIKALYIYSRNCIFGIMVSMLVSSVVDLLLESWSGQIKGYKTGICCLSTKLAALRSKSKD